MKIDIGNGLYMRSDTMNYVISERKVVKSGKNEGEEYFDDIAFYPYFDWLLNDVLKHEILTSEAESFEQIYEVIQDTEERLESKIVEVVNAMYLEREADELKAYADKLQERKMGNA